MLKEFYYWFHKTISRPQERGEYSSGYWQDMVRTNALKLCESLDGNILEVGCGEGLFLTRLALAHKDKQIYGIDNCEDILQKADRRLKEKNIENVKLSCADATSLPFEDSYFDTVVCINVILNLDSIDVVKKALREITRVCKKEGKVIFDFRNSKNPLLYLKYKLASYYDKTVENLPLKTYRLEEILSLVEELDFKTIRKINLGFPLKRPAPIIILELKKL